uniref:Nuclear receptor domain-containing protein n=1 Tax=Globodera rostochiensis TaxID=31243 RepID=A0A914GRQ6_GLORO
MQIGRREGALRMSPDRWRRTDESRPVEACGRVQTGGGVRTHPDRWRRTDESRPVEACGRVQTGGGVRTHPDRWRRADASRPVEAYGRIQTGGGVRTHPDRWRRTDASRPVEAYGRVQTGGGVRTHPDRWRRADASRPVEAYGRIQTGGGVRTSPDRWGRADASRPVEACGRIQTGGGVRTSPDRWGRADASRPVEAYGRIQTGGGVRTSPDRWRRTDVSRPVEAYGRVQTGGGVRTSPDRWRPADASRPVEAYGRVQTGGGVRTHPDRWRRTDESRPVEAYGRTQTDGGVRTSPDRWRRTDVSRPVEAYGRVQTGGGVTDVSRPVEAYGRTGGGVRTSPDRWRRTDVSRPVEAYESNSDRWRRTDESRPVEAYGRVQTGGGVRIEFRPVEAYGPNPGLSIQTRNMLVVERIIQADYCKKQMQQNQQNLNDDLQQQQFQQLQDGKRLEAQPTTTTATPNNSSKHTKNRQPTAQVNRELFCDICANVADGIHFGSLSCSACSAFFRRSISEHKRYICLTRDCDVKKPVFLEGKKHGTVCRYCRFQKCILAGMCSEEVQPKRGYKKMASSTETLTESPTNNKKVSTSGANNLAKQLKASKFGEKRENDHLLDGMSENKVKLVPMNNVLPIGLISEDSIIIFVKSVRRKIDFLRQQQTKRDECFLKKLDISEVWTIFFQEKSLFCQCVMGDSALGAQFLQCQISSDEQHLIFLSWLTLESAFCTLQYGGIQLNRAYLPGQGFMELHVDGLMEFYKPKFSFEAKSLASIALPIGRFFLDSLCRSIHMEHFKGLEKDAIFALLLLNVKSNFANHSDPEVAACREQLQRQIFNELSLVAATSQMPIPNAPQSPFSAAPSAVGQQPSTSTDTTATKLTGTTSPAPGPASEMNSELTSSTSTSSSTSAKPPVQQKRQQQEQWTHRLPQFDHQKIAQSVGGIVLVQCPLLQLIGMLREHYNALTISR